MKNINIKGLCRRIPLARCVYVLMLTAVFLAYTTFTSDAVTVEKSIPTDKLRLAVLDFERVGSDKRYDFLRRTLPEILITGLVENKNIEFVDLKALPSTTLKTSSAQQTFNQPLDQVSQSEISDVYKTNKIDLVLRGDFVTYLGQIRFTAVLENMQGEDGPGEIFKVSSNTVNTENIYSEIDRFAGKFYKNFQSFVAKGSENSLAFVCFTDRSPSPHDLDGILEEDIPLSLMGSPYRNEITLIPWDKTEMFCKDESLSEESISNVSKYVNPSAVIGGGFEVLNDSITITTEMYIKALNTTVPLKKITGSVNNYFRLEERLAKDVSEILDAITKEGGGWSKEPLDFLSDNMMLEDYINKGIEYMNVEIKAPLAALMFSTAVNIAPDSFEAHYHLGLIRETQGRYTEAVKEITRALELNPESMEGYLLLGDLYRKQTHYDESIKAYKDAQNLAGGNIDLKVVVSIKKANVYSFLKRYNDAVRELNYARKLLPENHKVLEGLRDVYFREGREKLWSANYLEAIEAFNKAVEADPDFTPAYNAKGRALSELTRYGESVEAFDLAIKADPDYAPAYNAKGRVLSELTRYGESVEAFDLAIKADPGYAAAYSGKVDALNALGRYEEAVNLYRDSQEIYKKLTEEEHLGAATSLNNLAFLYEEKGDYQKAEPLFKSALEIRENALAPEHLDIATSLNNLALLYYNKGDYQKAEPLLKRTLKIREDALGQEHPDYATSLDNLALLYENLGDYQKAEPLLKSALKIREKALGPVHPYTATSLNNLAALLYENKGDYQKAELLLKRALMIREKALGPEHPDYATSLDNLALLYENLGDYQKAEPLLKSALEIREKALGPGHPYTATSLSNLALLYEEKGDYEKAEPLLKSALEIREKAFGPEDPYTATSLDNLALLYEHKGDYQKAEPLLKRAIKIREKALGPDHPDTTTSLNNLALLYISIGDYEKAEPLLKREWKESLPRAPLSR